MTPVLNLSSFGLLAAATARCGADISTVLAQLEMEFAADGAALHKLALADVAKLLHALESGAKSQYFPFAFADVFKFDGQPELAAYLISAKRLRDLGPLLTWIPRLIHPSIRFETLDEGHWAYTMIHVDDPSGEHTDLPAFVELIAAAVVSLCRTAFAASELFHTVQFSHSARVSQQQYNDFFHCPVSFNHAETCLVQESQLLDQPLPGSLPATHAQAEESIRLKLLGDGVAPPLELQVSDLLRQRPDLLSGGIAALAERIRLSPRTLQRRLGAEGCSYSEVLARTRHELACGMLRDSSLDIDSIAYKLGFNERRSFSQAFQRWQGQTPSGYRRATRR